jgi:hypothetical protein
MLSAVKTFELKKMSWEDRARGVAGRTHGEVRAFSFVTEHHEKWRRPCYCLK